ncbi:hypothetical protein UlMin_025383 [Ulmus minor]
MLNDFYGKRELNNESETDSKESNVSGSNGDDTSRISWFCNLRGNEFFCEVDDDYIQYEFNLCGLSSQGDIFTEEQNELIESAPEMLYGLIHHLQLDKYKNYDFGRCPRVYYCGQACLPVGQSNIPRTSSTKV